MSVHRLAEIGRHTWTARAVFPTPLSPSRATRQASMVLQQRPCDSVIRIGQTRQLPQSYEVGQKQQEGSKESISLVGIPVRLQDRMILKGRKKNPESLSSSRFVGGSRGTALSREAAESMCTSARASLHPTLSTTTAAATTLYQ